MHESITKSAHSFNAAPRCGRVARRGVSSVLAMMFLVIFGSLAAAMAVVAHGNMRTADSSLKLSRAMSAAETGMVFARRRLAQEAARFVVTKGVVDADFAERMWMGTYSNADGTVTILQPAGYNTGPGVIHAVRDAHNADDHNIVVSGAPAQATIDQTWGRLRAPAVAMTNDVNTPYFILTYQLVDDAPYIRVTSEGWDGHIKRTLEMDFRIDKKIEFALLSPNRVMIGKNVLIEGPLGTHYGIHAGELNSGNGDPLVMRSDFYYLDPDLDVKLDLLHARVKSHDVDGDTRLRPSHPTESAGLNSADLIDYNNDEYVDDFDLFLKHFDSNNDRRIEIATEFANIDDQLARLIDQANPDRDGDGVKGTAMDVAFGYNDGVIDVHDQYAKVRGRLAFAVSRSLWESAKASGFSYQQVVKGPIRHQVDVAPTTFEVTEDEMRLITTEMFSGSQNWFQNTGTANFAAQAGAPAELVWEAVPFGAVELGEGQFGTRGAYDYYRRPVYRNLTFTNVKIPKNTNALFENCTFVGVTWVETNENCTHHDWNYTGALKKWLNPNTGTVEYIPRFENMTVPWNSGQLSDTRTESNNIRFHDCTFLGSVAGTRPGKFTHWRNKIQMTGNTRFYLDPEDADLAAQPDASTLIAHLNSLSATARAEMEKSSILLPGWSLDAGSFTNEAPKIKLNGTIVAGVFDIRGTAEVHGTLLMTYRPIPGDGALHYGGLPDAFNTTIGYFHASDGDSEGGDPGDSDFDGFGEIVLRYNPDAKLPDGIPWPLRIDADPSTYVE